MKYLTLIIFVFLSFNLKAESYVCAYESSLGEIRQDILYRDGDVFKQGSREYDLTESEENQWIVLNEIFLYTITNKTFSVEIKAINKETLEFVIFNNLVSPFGLESPTYPVTVETGTCTLMP